jgi:hypothetical protein
VSWELLPTLQSIDMMGADNADLRATPKMVASAELLQRIAEAERAPTNCTACIIMALYKTCTALIRHHTTALFSAPYFRDRLRIERRRRTSKDSGGRRDRLLDLLAFIRPTFNTGSAMCAQLAALPPTMASWAKPLHLAFTVARAHYLKETSVWPRICLEFGFHDFACLFDDEPSRYLLRAKDDGLRRLAN